MKFADHHIGNWSGQNIFNFLSIRKGLLEREKPLDFGEAYAVILEIALESDKNPKLKKLHDALKKLEQSAASCDENRVEMIRTLTTADEVLRKLDAKCQELTEPKK